MYGRSGIAFGALLVAGAVALMAAGGVTPGPAGGILQNISDWDGGVNVKGALCFKDGACMTGPGSTSSVQNVTPWDGGVGITGKLSASEVDLATTQKVCLNAACTVYIYNSGVHLYLKSPSGYSILDALTVSGAAVLNNGVTVRGAQYNYGGATFNGTIELPMTPDGGGDFVALHVAKVATIDFGAYEASIYLGSDGVLHLDTDGNEVHSNGPMVAASFVCAAGTCAVNGNVLPADGGATMFRAIDFGNSTIWPSGVDEFCFTNGANKFCIQGSGAPSVNGSAGISITKHCHLCGAPDGGAVGFDCTNTFVGGILTASTCN